MKQLRRLAVLILVVSTTQSVSMAQVRAVVTTDKDSYVYGDTMEICRIAVNDGLATEEIYEEGCCSDQIIINGNYYQQFYIHPYTSVGECVLDPYETCHLGFVTWPLEPGQSEVKECMQLRLVNEEHCFPGLDFTSNFEVTDPMRIQVFIEGIGNSVEYLIPVDLNLPVELSDWEATITESGVAFLWSTLSESENAYFEIEMSRGGEFRTIATVAGNGSTVERNDYQYNIPSLSSGNYQFRLSQTDFDGTRRELGTVELLIPLEGEFELSAAYPNPSSQQFNMDLKVKNAQFVEVDLFDLYGRQVANLYSGESQANESIRIASSGLELANGSYVYRVRGEYFEKDGVVTIQK